jgi:hypothetical protein
MITEEKAKDITLLLRTLRKQGATAIPGILEFLHQGTNIDFARMKGGGLIGQSTLRQALINTLGQIGGDESLSALSSLLSTLQDPAEIALLGQQLEKEAPGVYQAEIVRVASNLLYLWADQNQIDIRPLFELLQTVGGIDAAAVLDQFPANANNVKYLRNKDTRISPTVRTYATMALAGLPEGEGIPRLISLAADSNVPVQDKPELPFQMLAQSAMDYEEAGKALIDLARAGQIPDKAWQSVGEALAGYYLQFPSQFSGGMLPGQKNADRSVAEAPFLRGYYDDEKNLQYEQRLISADWSSKQVSQQIALIDDLMNATASQTAKQALQRARESLQNGPRGGMR